MCCSFELFHPYRPISNMSVNLPDATKVLVTHIGDVELFDNLTIDQVLYIPLFSLNLVSASKLTKPH